MTTQHSHFILSLLLASLLLIVSCSLENPNGNPELIIDPPTYGHLSVWKALEHREGSANWEPPVLADSLYLFSNSTDTVRPRNGEYRYSSLNSKIGFGEWGAFIQKDSLMLFLSNPNLTDTIVVAYTMDGDSLLILKNTSVSPKMEIKYRNVPLPVN